MYTVMYYSISFLLNYLWLFLTNNYSINRCNIGWFYLLINPMNPLVSLLAETLEGRTLKSPKDALQILRRPRCAGLVRPPKCYASSMFTVSFSPPFNVPPPLWTTHHRRLLAEISHLSKVRFTIATQRLALSSALS